MNHTNVVVEDIVPLTDEIKRICLMHSIPFSFIVELNSDTGECQASGYIPPDRDNAPKPIVDHLDFMRGAGLVV